MWQGSSELPSWYGHGQRRCPRCTAYPTYSTTVIAALLTTITVQPRPVHILTPYPHHHSSITAYYNNQRTYSTTVVAALLTIITVWLQSAKTTMDC